MFKPANVVMLPTKNKATGENIIIKQFGELGLAYGNNILNAQHIYITSDEEIKEGDWILTDENTIMQAEGFYGSYPADIINSIGGQFKIITTTDNSLKVHHFDNSLKVHHFDKGVFKDLEYSLPQPSQQFIEKYIEEYNKGNIITDIMVEYDYADHDLALFRNEQTLKINSKDNTITIKKVKDSWSREEVIRLCETAYFTGNNNIQFTMLKNDFNKWLEQNL